MSIPDGTLVAIKDNKLGMGLGKVYKGVVYGTIYYIDEDGLLYISPDGESLPSVKYGDIVIVANIPLIDSTLVDPKATVWQVMWCVCLLGLLDPHEHEADVGDGFLQMLLKEHFIEATKPTMLYSDYESIATDSNLSDIIEEKDRVYKLQKDKLYQLQQTKLG